MGNISSGSKWYPSVRRAWAQRRAYSAGVLNRADLERAFGITAAQASADIRQILVEDPGCMHYDLQLKTYVWTDSARDPGIEIPDPVREFVV